MADGPAGERTEQPTSKKLSDARKDGNIPKSRDLSAALDLLAAMVILKYLGGYLANFTKSFTAKVLVEQFGSNQPMPERKEIIPYLLDWGMSLGLLLLPYLIAVYILVYMVGFLQVGWLFTTKPLTLKLNKLNPVEGLKRLFKLSNLVMLAMNIAKLAVIGPIAWYTVLSELRNAITITSMDPVNIFSYQTTAILNLGIKLAIILLILGLADWIYQKHKHIEKLKMTKQEVKEEYKQSEGDPKIKAKRRQIQQKLAMERMMKEVPQAEVVVRNPTHFAVAISYRPEMAAPVVVAKGKDKMAERIIAVAREAKVPLVENPPLARELFKKTEVGDQIPPELFATVAELLAHVMRGEKRERLLKAFAGQAA